MQFLTSAKNEDLLDPYMKGKAQMGVLGNHSSPTKTTWSNGRVSGSQEFEKIEIPKATEPGEKQWGGVSHTVLLVGVPSIDKAVIS